MKRLFALGLMAALFAAAPVHAGTIEIGVQWTLQAGFSSQWTGLNNTGGCGAPNNGGNNCGQIPMGTTLHECVGSQTIKNGGVEVLGRILVGTAASYETIWQAESYTQSTIIIRTPVLSPNDPQLAGGNSVWIEFQAGSPQDNTGYEVQITCSVY